MKRILWIALCSAMSFAAPLSAQTITVDFSEKLSSGAYDEWFTVEGANQDSNVPFLNALRPGHSYMGEGLFYFKTTVHFTQPVTNISFDYNYLGLFSPIYASSVAADPNSFNMTSLTPDDRWCCVSRWYHWEFNNVEPTQTLRFNQTYMNIAYGVDNLRFTVVPVPAPVAGAGLLAAVAGLLFTALRRRRSRSRSQQ